MKAISSIRLLAFTGTAALAAVFSPSLQAAAFQNGSFETNGGDHTQAVTGWALASTNGGLGVLNGEGTTSGTFAIGFDYGEVATGTSTLSQSFTTVALQTYRVTLDFGAIGNNTTSLSRLQVEARDGVSLGSGAELITSGSGVLTGTTGGSLNQNTNVIQMSDSSGVPAVNGAAPNAQFSTITFQFTAQSANTTFVFTDLSTGGTDGQDPILDNVRIGVVPEPSTWVLLGLGAGVLGLAAHRRRARLA